MHISKYVYIHVYVYTYIYTHTYAYVCKCTHECVYKGAGKCTSQNGEPQENPSANAMSPFVRSRCGCQ